MPDKADDNMLDVKKRVGNRLLPMEFVSGVGIQKSGLTVYLIRSLSPDEHQKVETVISAEAPGTPVEFVVTGSFKATGQ